MICEIEWKKGIWWMGNNCAYPATFFAEEGPFLAERRRNMWFTNISSVSAQIPLAKRRLWSQTRHFKSWDSLKLYICSCFYPDIDGTFECVLLRTFEVIRLFYLGNVKIMIKSSVEVSRQKFDWIRFHFSAQKGVQNLWSWNNVSALERCLGWATERD